MSKRGNELRKLMQIPPPADVKLILDSLANETDRAAALVASALIETALEQLIRHSLKKADKELTTQLFQQRGPMADFHSKILVAAAFGVIDATLEIELNIVRNIRNVFAHATANLSFDTAEIAAEVGRSTLAKIINDAVLQGLQQEMGQNAPLREAPSKVKFYALTRLLFTILNNMQKKLSGSSLSDE
jgi:hypothetical protein